VSGSPFRFDNSYTRLPDPFYSRVRPMPVASPGLVIINRPLAASLGIDLDGQCDDDLARLFAGQTLPDGAEPIAQAYAGHQFGGFTVLGDGRAMLIGEHLAPDGRRIDVQFKGSGPTPYSRGGDGRAALGPMLREFIISEAMHGLGIPTTRSLAVVATGEPVYRQPIQRGAILTRLAASHLRVGTFELFMARRDPDSLRTLADYAIARHDPDLADRPAKYADFLRSVCERQARLIARWQLVGFVHGVMNTDNVSIAGETIDFGPCAFIDSYDPKTVFSSIDRGGRYAYDQQPVIAQWNLARFAETLLPLLNDDEPTAIAMATEILGDYPRVFREAWLAGMRAKLGLATAEEDDAELAIELLSTMHAGKLDFTNTFRMLADTIERNDDTQPTAWNRWRGRWRSRWRREQRSACEIAAAMNRVNPAVIARNHRVEQALAAAERGDPTPLHRLVAVLQTPFGLTPGDADLADPPPADFGPYRTFCGT
jgi:uncharacterized protein YdiU (UPF0061 family)